MTVSLNWLSNVSLIINTTVIQAPTFNNCLMIGLFPSGSIPGSWDGLTYHVYTNYADIVSDFSSLITGTTTQDKRYKWLLNGAQCFFGELPTPTQLTIYQMAPDTTDYTTAFSTLVDTYNDFYAFYIADKLTISNFTTATTGIIAAMTALTSANNLKVLFVDSDDMATTDSFAAQLKEAGGHPRIIVTTATNNLTPIPPNTTAAKSYAMAAMGAYFTNLFTTTVPLKPLSGQKLQSVTYDPAITTSNIGIPGSSTGYINDNSNVYPGFGNSNIGLLQYGYMSSSTSDSQLYLDQIVGYDYLKQTCESDIATYLISKQATGGLFYDNEGIQGLVSTFRSSLQKSVNQKIIQPLLNSSVTWVNYAQVSPTDIANRIYKDLSANVFYLSRIQRVSITGTISI